MEETNLPVWSVVRGRGADFFAEAKLGLEAAAQFGRKLRNLQTRAGEKCATEDRAFHVLIRKLA